MHLLHWHYGGWYPALLLDKGSSHTANGSPELIEGLSIELSWLPERSPKLNHMESPWDEGRDMFGPYRWHATMDDQVDWFFR